MPPEIWPWLVYGLWLVVIVYLIVAGIGVKRDTEPHPAQSLGLLFLLIVAFLLPRLPVLERLNLTPVNPVLNGAGIILEAGGLVFFVWARQTLGKNWSQTVAAKADHELVTSGPYRFVRHPMYAAGFSPASVRPLCWADRSSSFSSWSVACSFGASAPRTNSLSERSLTAFPNTNDGRGRSFRSCGDWSTS